MHKQKLANLFKRISDLLEEETYKLIIDLLEEKRDKINIEIQN